MGIGYFLQFGFAQHALEAAFLVAVSCGLIGPFVITRTMSFAVHGTSEPSPGPSEGCSLPTIRSPARSWAPS
jgi:hypothetical protein